MAIDRPANFDRIDSLVKCSSGIRNLAVEHQVALFVQIVEPLIKHDITAPTPVQFCTMRAQELAQRIVMPLLANRHRLGKLPVEIDPHQHVRIDHESAIGL